MLFSLCFLWLCVFAYLLPHAYPVPADLPKQAAFVHASHHAIMDQAGGMTLAAPRLCLLPSVVVFPSHLWELFVVPTFSPSLWLLVLHHYHATYAFCTATVIVLAWVVCELFFPVPTSVVFGLLQACDAYQTPTAACLPQPFTVTSPAPPLWIRIRDRIRWRKMETFP